MRLVPLFAFLLALIGVSPAKACGKNFSRSCSDSVPVVPERELQLLREWRAGEVVSIEAVKAFGIERCFGTATLEEAGVLPRMRGKSMPEGCPVVPSELRYVRTLHKDDQGHIRIGEMVCNKAIAADLVEIFRQLYDAGYPIERMVLIDNYDADDERSMQANNSSCFCFRKVAGFQTLSHHALGMAVDINTLHNPYVKRRADGSLFIQPSTAGPYADRSKPSAYKIERGDLCYRLFISHGFSWGGNWKSLKDYQHFEK